MTSTHFAVAAINEDAVFWLNASAATKEILRKAGAPVPTITQDDRWVAAQRAAAAAQAAPKVQP